MNKIKETNASFLSQLTDGTHLHTLQADSSAKIDNALRSLHEAGLLIDSV
jgi:uncharacterized protein